LAEETNTQHQKGLDLNNELGGNVFNDINSAAQINSRINASTENSTTVQSAYVQIDDVAQLTLDDYELEIGDNNTLIVKRLPDGERVNLTQAAAAPAPTLVDNTYYLDATAGTLDVRFEGMSIQVQTTTFLGIGESFTVQPTRFAAANIDNEITNPKQVALASPIRVLTDSNNTGSGSASVEVTDPFDTVFLSIAATDQLAPPVQVVFDNASPMEYTVFDVSNPLDPQPVVGHQDQQFNQGQQIVLNGYTISFEGVPQAGDRFDFDFNKDGVSDNRNALALSDIQAKKVLVNGSLQDHYSGIVEKIGAMTASGKINLTASQAVLSSTENTLASIIGVNLDEEAARLVQYQQAYAASARIITTSQELFATLLASF